MLQNLLRKFNVTEFSQLTEEEKETYRSWEEILSGRKLTDDDVAEFLNREKDEVECKLINPNLSQREDVFLKMKLEFIKKIKVFLSTPAMEKKALEESIKKMI